MPFLAKQHVLFALRHAKFLPTPYQAEDSNRMTLAYFCLSALALLPSSAVSTVDLDRSALEVMLKETQKEGYAAWVYEQQLPKGGFRGSDAFVGASTSPEPAPSTSAPPAAPPRHAAPQAMSFSASFSSIDTPHVIQSYTALLTLALLDDDFSRLNRQGLLDFLGSCQNEDGSFSHFPGCPERPDPRSTYSAFAVASMLNDWSTIDVDRALAFLNSCRRYEGGFAQWPGAEANAGPTYCAIASFSLASRLSSLPSPERLLRWLVDRQVRPPPPPPPSEPGSDDEEDEEHEREAAVLREAAGFQGRANKPTDACYSFWNTAALQLLLPAISPSLRLSDILDPALDRAWLLSCQHQLYGGIAREPGALPDVMHHYLSLAALSLGDAASTLNLRSLDPAWNLSREVGERIRARLWRR
ncbi:geranylgeranyl transferase type-1 subunit beta [Rhodosporidiobolus nylandii]